MAEGCRRRFQHKATMKTLLLNPPSFENFDGGASSRWPATREITSYWYPVWLCYPAGMIPNSKVVDAPPHDITVEQTIQMSRDFDFVVLFLKTKGNIKEMERELGISYWTIRSKLGEIVAQLGLEEEAEPPASGEAIAARRQAILDQLSDGSIGVEEAAAQLERLKKKRGN